MQSTRSASMRARRMSPSPDWLEVGMEVAAEGVGVLGAEVGGDAANGEVHEGEAAGEAFPKRLRRSVHFRGGKPVHQWKTVCLRHRHGKPQNAPEIIRFGFVSASGG